ncbi:unnamed protein product [Nippostrongylus brasiliensis]|uniref:Uncharacterized protein n=1 Tax=Nippostrongylus brasiliensis TaxID=27835 RepID=A0A0N4Y1C4_NIPBR|nr:hypothetical protein Q1695_005638 [Nippostrongylus brasiliensis]VDL72999.1 unnamed protein product [Nippostrongylus brasiliensis]
MSRRDQRRSKTAVDDDETIDSDQWAVPDLGSINYLLTLELAWPISEARGPESRSHTSATDNDEQIKHTLELCDTDRYGSIRIDMVAVGGVSRDGMLPLWALWNVGRHTAAVASSMSNVSGR